MRRIWRRRVSQLLLLLLLVGSETAVQGAPAADPAQKLLDSGRRLLKKGDFKEAVIVLMQAQAASPSPEVKLELAAAYEGLNSLVEAAQLYESLAAETELTAEQKKRREERLAGLRPRLGRLTITCEVQGAEVEVNGNEVGTTPLSQQIYVEPGDVVIVVKDADRQARVDREVDAGDDVTVRVELKARPTGQPPPQPQVSPLPPPPQVQARPAPRAGASARQGRAEASGPDTRRDSGGVGFPPRLAGRRWTWVAAAGGIVFGIIGLGLGASAYTDYEEYKDAETPPSRYPELEDRFGVKATAANAMFGLAGALAVTAVVLFLVEGALARREAPRESRPHVVGASMAPGSVLVHTSF